MKCQNCKEELKRNPSFETYKCVNDECRMGELGYLEPSYFGPQWISVEDKLPEKYCHEKNPVEILVKTKRKGTKLGWHIGYKKPTIISGVKEYQFTDWMPLP